MDKALRERSAELVAKAVTRSIAPWIQREKRASPLTGLPEFMTWITDVDRVLRAFRDPDGDTLAARSWLQLARLLAEQWTLAEEIRDGKRPPTEFGKATHIDGALQRVLFASVRGFLAAKLGTQPVPKALEKLGLALERMNEVLAEHAQRDEKEPRPTVTREVARRVRGALGAALGECEPRP